jgi:hypothetical protein
VIDDRAFARNALGCLALPSAEDLTETVLSHGVSRTDRFSYSAEVEPLARVTRAAA